MPGFLTPITGKPRYLPDTMTGNGDFEPARSLYVPYGATLRTYRAALGKAVAGTGLCEIAWAGPSTAQGYDNPIRTQSPAAYLIALLKGRGLTAQSGWVWTGNNFGGTNKVDDRWTTSGGTLAYNASLGNTPIARTGAIASTLTYTSTETGTILEWILSPSGTHTLAIDGGAANAQTAVAAAGYTLRSTTGLSNATHTGVWAASQATPNQTYIVGARVRGTSGILISDAGFGGSTSTDWDTTLGNANYATQKGMRGGSTPHLVLFDTSTWINDIDASSWTQAQSVAAITRIVNQMKTAGSDVLMLITSDPSTTTAFGAFGIKSDATYQAYRQALYGIADATSTMLLDCPDRVGQWAAANTAGLMNDAYHFTPAGNAHLARAVDAVLMA